MALRNSDSRAARARKAAIASHDANRILLHFKKSVAVALYYHSLNAVTASKLSEAELLKLKGINVGVIRAIKMAIATADVAAGKYKGIWPFPQPSIFKV